MAINSTKFFDSVKQDVTVSGTLFGRTLSKEERIEAQRRKREEERKAARNEQEELEKELKRKKEEKIVASQVLSNGLKSLMLIKMVSLIKKSVNF